MGLGINITGAILENGHFYLDPGSGSFILQLALAALLGAGFAIKMYWKKIKTLFKRNQPAEPSAAPDDDQKTPHS